MFPHIEQLIEMHCLSEMCCTGMHKNASTRTKALWCKSALNAGVFFIHSLGGGLDRLPKVFNITEQVQLSDYLLLYRPKPG